MRLRGVRHPARWRRSSVPCPPGMEAAARNGWRLNKAGGGYKGNKVFKSLPHVWWTLKKTKSVYQNF